MRILFVIDTYDTNNNGTSISAQRFAEELRRCGHEVIGDIDTVYSNDWYNDKLHFQYYSNSVTEGDSVVMTCEFAR